VAAAAERRKAGAWNFGHSNLQVCYLSGLLSTHCLQHILRARTFRMKLSTKIQFVALLSPPAVCLLLCFLLLLPPLLPLAAAAAAPHSV
jgi:hypothetical protein